MFPQTSSGFLSPPAVFVLLFLVGVLLSLLWRRLGIAVSLIASLCLYALATPALSSALLHHIEASLPTGPDFAGAQAIVVLGGDMRLGETPDPDTLGPLTLERVVFAARAYRQLHLPIAISAGESPTSRATFGDLMKASLEQDFGIPVRWNEDHSRTTYENAADIARLLAAAGIKPVVVVTQSWH